jgi:hypothetical protein
MGLFSKKMKHFILVWSILLSLFVNAQVSDEKINLYAKQLAVRSAHLIQCDSISPAIEAVYSGFFKAVLSTRGKVPRYTRLITIQEIHHNWHKEILTFLKGKSKRIYRRLWRNTGNILLIKRRR